MTIDDGRPLVTLVLPAYNEAQVLEQSLADIYAWLDAHSEYRWEVILVNDGSTDGTREIAERAHARLNGLTVVHHPRNFGLGQAFRTGFARSTGDYVITFDVGLSYSPDHIGALLAKLRTGRNRLVLASPYMSGGKLSNVPWLRRVLSICANRFLAFFARGRLSTLTCLVRGYDGPFIRSLVLRAMGMDVMPETVYKSMIMRAGIDQMPAHLDWSRQVAAGPQHRSSVRILRHTIATIFSGFLFRPFMIFVLPGLLLLIFALYVNTWMIIHFFEALDGLPPDTILNAASAAVAIAYQKFPHTFIVGLLSLMLSIQLISLGVAALQAKSYFEELFYLGSTVRKELRESREERHRE
jgi:glycosyltransferase involved in cell wall biosynthesis